MRAILILFVLGVCSINAQNSATVTIQDLRETLVNVQHAVAVLDNKHERHETRERALGELVKKGLITLQKNQKIFEPIKATFDRLDKRVSEMETMMLNNEKQRTEEQTKLTTLLEKILAAFEGSTQSNSRFGEDGDEIDDEKLPKKIDNLIEIVGKLRTEIAEFKADQNSIEITNKNLVAQAEKLVSDKTSQGEFIVKKLEHIDEISTSLKEIKSNLKGFSSVGGGGAGNGNNGLSEFDRIFLKELSNETRDAIQDMRFELLTASDKIFTKTANRIKASHDIIEEMAKNLNEVSSVVEGGESGGKSDGLVKLEKIMLDTSNNVLETKRRFEYGIHQIILEVGDVMKTANSSMQKRLNELNDGILENHNIALSNLSTKIETEMSQVWRQIGIMYQEITSSKKALDKLQEQTEIYVNGTITNMDSMQGKVGLISNRMLEVEGDLNYLLGRLSLVTQEFNNIKLGLGEALENIRESFDAVKKEVNRNVGPGPHRISDYDRNDDLNAINKRSISRFHHHHQSRQQ